VKVTFTMYPEEGARFAKTAFDKQIGKVIPVLAEIGVSQATLLEAKVADDGTHAELTVDGDLRLPTEPVTDYSFGVPDGGHMTNPNWAIPGAQAFLSKPTTAHEAAEARAARQRSAVGTVKEIQAQREREIGTLRARHEVMLSRATDPILRALIEAHGPSGNRLWPDCAECPPVPNEYDTDPESWPCGVWMFISDRLEVR
jgi:hypothetical protein